MDYKIQKKHTIFHFTGNLDTYNGAGLQALTLMKNLQASHNIFAIYKADVKHYERVEIEGVTAYKIPNQKSKMYWSLIRLFIKFRPRVFHVHGFWVGREGIFVSWLFRVPVLLKTTLIDVDDLETICKGGRFNRWLVKGIAFNNALSTPILKINSRFISPAKVGIIPNLVNCPTVPIKVEDKDNVMVFAGCIMPRKGVKRAISVFLDCFSEKESSTLILAGPQPEKYNDYFKECLNLIPTEKQGSIEFIGSITQSELFVLLDKAKALFLFSEGEGLPNAVLEAMAHNCVPIISPMQGIAYDLIAEPSHGIIVENDFKRLNWPEIDSLISHNCIFERAKTNYDCAVVAKKYADLYQKL